MLFICLFLFIFVFYIHNIYNEKILISEWNTSSVCTFGTNIDPIQVVPRIYVPVFVLNTLDSACSPLPLLILVGLFPFFAELQGQGTYC